jgi:hypothetical protein
MNEPKDKGGKPPAPAAKRSGRVGFDERGNSVWEWQLETGVYSRDVSTQKLKKLELGDLSIAETAINPRPPGLSGEPRATRGGGGFNPYDNSSEPSRGFDPYDSGASTGAKWRPPQPAEPAPRKQVDAKKMEEWLKAKKRAEENKEDGD